MFLVRFRMKSITQLICCKPRRCTSSILGCIDAFKMTREFKYASDNNARALLFRWCEHRANLELPLWSSLWRRICWTCRQASLGSILAASSHGDYPEPALFMTEMPDSTRIGLDPRQMPCWTMRTSCWICLGEALIFSVRWCHCYEMCIRKCLMCSMLLGRCSGRSSRI